ncbi:MAG: GntR family transcriptional regulator [Bifidobacteriaceae bacterium]|nr:GntR family transcriptional regulator [Bifidobacteriaceae bacterium]
MIVRIDHTSPVPIFEQLRSQLERLIVSGQLAAGSRLPAIRHLAIDLGIAPGTVAKVYEALAREGLVTSARRHGTTVAARPACAGANPRTAAEVQQAAESLVVVARQGNIGLEAALRSVSQAWSRLAGET